ncbi:hypothetical protein V491_05043, partial [Pseudogymnoascus sp. VKM F-3775]
HQRRRLQPLWDIVAGLEDEEGFAPISQLHGIVLLCVVHTELDLLLRRPQQRELAETHVERRAGQRAVLLLDDNDVNCAAEGCWVDRVPCLRDRAADAPHVLHRAVEETIGAALVG